MSSSKGKKGLPLCWMLLLYFSRNRGLVLRYQFFCTHPLPHLLYFTRRYFTETQSTSLNIEMFWNMPAKKKKSLRTLFLSWHHIQNTCIKCYHVLQKERMILNFTENKMLFTANFTSIKISSSQFLKTQTQESLWTFTFVKVPKLEVHCFNN